MIKKCLVILFAMLGVITHANANIKISPEAADSAIREIFSQEKDKASALATFKANLQADGGISALSIWKVCAAGGLDYDKNAADKTKCKQLQKKLLKDGSVTYFEVCGKDKGKSKGTEYCVDDFFTNKFIGGTQVQMSTAIALAQEYARVKDKDDSVTCSSAYREVGNDEAVKCASQNKNVFYEFVFDDVKETSDDTIRKSSQTAVCKMYGVESVEPRCNGGNGMCIGAVCKADEPTCQKINESLQKFGLSSKFVNGQCSVRYDRLTNKKQLKTAFGIDNFAFCKGMGIQVGNEPAVDKYLKDYVAKQAGISASEVTCDPGFKTYTGQGCNVGMFAARDDVKTCHAKGQQIDFVFDDINELWETYKKGGVQAMSCKVSGGTYAGKRCIGLGKQQCDVLRKSNIATCPQCKAAEWDEATQSCVLPSAADAAALEKGINITVMVGGAALGVVVTVATGGAGAALVLTGIETVGSAIEITSQLQINGIADDFLVESNKCKSASCAERIIHQNLQRMSNIANDLLDAESAAVDSEFVRLINLLPDNSKILKNLVGNEGALAKNKKGFFDADSWEPEQVWRAVGVGLQLTSLATSLGSWASRKMPRATNALVEKAKGLRKLLVNNADEAVDAARVIGNKIDDVADATKRVIANTDEIEDAVSAANKAMLKNASTGQPVSDGFKLLNETDDIVDTARTAATKVETVIDNADEFAKYGVKETMVNGKPVYTDIKTGKTLSDTQVYNKIPSSLNDEFAEIGVRQIDTGKSGARYLDTEAGRFISSDEVVKRIDDMPSASVTKGTNSANEAIDSSRRTLLKNSSSGKPALVDGELVFDKTTDAAKASTNVVNPLDETLDATKATATNADDALMKATNKLDAAKSARAEADDALVKARTKAQDAMNKAMSASDDEYYDLAQKARTAVAEYEDATAHFNAMSLRENKALLDAKYVKGDISKADYDTMLKKIQSSARESTNIISPDTKVRKIVGSQERMLNNAEMAYDEGRATLGQANLVHTKDGDRGFLLGKVKPDGTIDDTVGMLDSTSGGYFSYKNQAADIMREEVKARAQLNTMYNGDIMKQSKEIQQVNREFLEAATNVTTEDDFAKLLKDRHYKIENVIMESIGGSEKIQNVANARRAKYLDIVANNDKLKNTALNWERTTNAQKSEFFTELFKKAYPDIKQPEIKVVDLIENDARIAGGASSTGRSIQMASKSTARDLNNLDQAMETFTHEYEHFLTNFEPKTAGIMPDNMVYDSLKEAPTLQNTATREVAGAFMALDKTSPDAGDKGYRIINSSWKDYEEINPFEAIGRKVGKTVGSGFLDSLKQMVK